MLRFGFCALTLFTAAACSTSHATDDVATSSANDTTSGPLTLQSTSPLAGGFAAASLGDDLAVVRSVANQTVVTVVKSDGTAPADVVVPGLGAATFAAAFTQGDGVVVAGTAGRFFVTRIAADGTIDATFRPDPLNIDLADAAVTKDGKLVLAGTLHGASKAVIVRLDATGSIDTSFAGGEGAWIDATAATAATHAIVDDSGVITFITVGADGTNARRLDATGTLDASYGQSGIAAVAPRHGSALLAGAYVADSTSYALDASGNVTGTSTIAGTALGATPAGLESFELNGDACTLHIGDDTATLSAAECAGPVPFVTLPDGRHAIVTTSSVHVYAP